MYILLYDSMDNIVRAESQRPGSNAGEVADKLTFCIAGGHLISLTVSRVIIKLADATLNSRHKPFQLTGCEMQIPRPLSVFR